VVTNTPNATSGTNGYGEHHCAACSRKWGGSEEAQLPQEWHELVEITNQPHIKLPTTTNRLVMSWDGRYLALPPSRRAPSTRSWPRGSKTRDKRGAQQKGNATITTRHAVIAAEF